MSSTPQNRQLKNAAADVGKDPDDLARLLGLPDGYKLTTLVNMDEVREKVAASEAPTRDLADDSDAETTPRRRGRRGRREPKPLTEEQQRARQMIEWLVAVQDRALEFKQMELRGDPFRPAYEQDPVDRTMVRFPDPCADLLDDPNAIRKLPYAKVEEYKAKGKNLPPWSSKLKEAVKGYLQELMPRVCRCGAPLREIYEVTDQDVWDFLDGRVQVPTMGARGQRMRRLNSDDFHPECRTMEEERVALAIELESMDGDDPDVVALREARYEAFLDMALAKNQDKGATRESVHRAFRVFVLKEQVD